MSKRLSALALIAAVAIAACGSGEGSSGGGTAATSAAPEGVEIVSLGDREAGFGPGSQAVLAGEWIDRLAALEGAWQPGPLDPDDIPEVCGVPEPSALQRFSFSRPVDDSDVRADAVGAEVWVYESAAVAEGVVDLLNGASAEECDRVSADLVDVSDVQPGVRFDFGDGVGEPTATPQGLPPGMPAASRNYNFEVIFGTVSEPLVSKTTAVADGPVVVTFDVAAAAEQIEVLEADVVAALFAEPGPDLIDTPDLDRFGETVRRSVLTDDDFPSPYQFAAPMVFGGPGEPDECFEQGQPVATAKGPVWFSFTPGAGASQVLQRFRTYSDVDASTSAFDEMVKRGAECFPNELGMGPDFELADSASEVVNVEGQEVVLATLDFIQTINGEGFDVERQVAATQVGEHIYFTEFIGLPGDSPDIVKLLTIAAGQGQR